MHLIECHVAQRIIEVTVNGFWDEPHFDAFVLDLRAAIAGFPPGDRPPTTLYNYTHAAIQTQAVVARMRALAQHPSMIHRKVAMYTEGILARQQARRVAEGRDNMRVFDSRVSALAYLTGRDDALRSRLAPVNQSSHTATAVATRPASSGSITQVKADPAHLR